MTHPETDAPFLEALHLVKTFGRLRALDDVSLQVQPGEFVCILGPSGCGKTTLLRVIAGLERQDTGKILLRGEDISWARPAHRRCGIVFQSYALFPNLTAAQNVGYGIRRSGRSRTEVQARVREMLELVDMPDIGGKRPAHLSGGQQQRVALARALAPEPAFLLLDEPLSALDAKVRVRLRQEIRALQRRVGLTTIMVTHDQEEALTMADRVVVMNHGKSVQEGSPETIYRRPADPFVADFIGAMNFLGAWRREADGALRQGNRILRLDPSIDIRSPSLAVAIRPEDISLASREDEPNTFRCRIRDIEFRGAVYRWTLEWSDDNAASVTLDADLQPTDAERSQCRVGETVAVHLPPERLVVFPSASE